MIDEMQHVRTGNHASEQISREMREAHDLEQRAREHTREEQKAESRDEAGRALGGRDGTRRHEHDRKHDHQRQDLGEALGAPLAGGSAVAHGDASERGVTGSTEGGAISISPAPDSARRSDAGPTSSPTTASPTATARVVSPGAPGNRLANASPRGMLSAPVGSRPIASRGATLRGEPDMDASAGAARRRTRRRTASAAARRPKSRRSAWISTSAPDSSKMGSRTACSELASIARSSLRCRERMESEI